MSNNEILPSMICRGNQRWGVDMNRDHINNNGVSIPLGLFDYKDLFMDNIHEIRDGGRSGYRRAAADVSTLKNIHKHSKE